MGNGYIFGRVKKWDFFYTHSKMYIMDFLEVWVSSDQTKNSQVKEEKSEEGHDPLKDNAAKWLAKKPW